MNNEAAAVVANVVFSAEETVAGPWGLSVKPLSTNPEARQSDYEAEDVGCRGYAQGHTAEFKQILRVLAGCQAEG